MKVPPGTVPADVRVTFNIDKHGLLQLSGAELLEELPFVADDKASEDKKTNDEKKAEEGKSEDSKSAEGKKKYKKVDLEVITSTFSLSREQIKSSIELEASIAHENKLIIETADKRNELESYIYGTRTKIDGALQKYATSAEKSQLHSLLNNAEDWLYGNKLD